MDYKSRAVPKTSKVHSASNAIDAAFSEKKKMEKYSDAEKKCISDIKELYLKTIKLDVNLQQEIYNLEKSYESKHNEIYAERSKLLGQFRKTKQGNNLDQGGINNFWLRVLKASYTEFINKQDEKILTYLNDIRAKLFNDPVVKFVIEFHFDPNEYFTNSVLSKTYFLNCLPDPQNPFSYDGAEIFKCEGCEINWKHGSAHDKEKDKKVFSSFFDFFSPPILPDDIEDPNYGDTMAILENDFEVGFYLKERVIPKAIMFFTGEIEDCQSSDSDSEDNDDAENNNDQQDDGAYGTAAAN